MELCTTCRNAFEWEAFGWHGGDEKFCSMDCLPEGVLDESYAMDYTGLMESYQELESQFPVASYNEQEEMLEEIDYCVTQLEEYNFGDTEGSFYKEMLRCLYDKFLGLQEKVETYF